MTRNIALAKRLREVLLNGKWIANTNFKEQISDLDWAQAIQQVGKLNSIALLTYHIHYYLQGILKVFEGGELSIRDQFSFDMPKISQEEDWKKLVHDFIRDAERFANYVEQMEDAQLDHVFVDEKYGNYLRNIEGVIEHSYYHLGQVSLIRKMILQEIA